MTGPLRGRRDPQPVTRGWELAVAVAGAVLVLLVMAALLGLGLAAAFWGDGWVWPAATESVTAVVGGLLTGRPGRGLPPAELIRVAGPLATYACVGVAEVALFASAVLGGVLARRRFGTNGARGGFATRAEATRALGVRQLRDARAVIRPDRYGPTAGRPG